MLLSGSSGAHFGAQVLSLSSQQTGGSWTMSWRLTDTLVNLMLGLVGSLISVPEDLAALGKTTRESALRLLRVKERRKAMVTGSEV